MQVNAKAIWVSLFFVFFVGRVWLGKNEPEQLVMAFIIFFISAYWYIVPYFLGKNIKLFGCTYFFKKGVDDGARFICFVMGMIGLMASLGV